MREAFGETLYTIDEAAEMLGASVQRLHAMRRKGVLAAIPLKDSNGKAWQYHVTAEAIRAALSTPADPAIPPKPRKPANIEARDRRARESLRKMGVKLAR